MIGQLPYLWFCFFLKPFGGGQPIKNMATIVSKNLERFVRDMQKQPHDKAMLRRTEQYVTSNEMGIFRAIREYNKNETVCYLISRLHNKPNLARWVIKNIYYSLREGDDKRIPTKDFLLYYLIDVTNAYCRVLTRVEDVKERYREEIAPILELYNNNKKKPFGV